MVQLVLVVRLLRKVLASMRGWVLGGGMMGSNFDMDCVS